MAVDIRSNIDTIKLTELLAIFNRGVGIKNTNFCPCLDKLATISYSILISV
jgi:hypothetical protein